MEEKIPIALFVHAPPRHATRVLTCLCEYAVSLICGSITSVKSATDAAATVTALLASCCESVVVLSDDSTHQDLLFRRR